MYTDAGDAELTHCNIETCKQKNVFFLNQTWHVYNAIKININEVYNVKSITKKNYISIFKHICNMHVYNMCIVSPLASQMT